MMRTLLIDTLDASPMLLFRYQWLSSLLPAHTCSFVMQASQDISAAPLPRVLLAEPAFHWKGRKQGRLQAIKKLVESNESALWVSHQQIWQLLSPHASLWTAESFPIQAPQIALPVSPWAEPPEWEYLAEICDAEASGHAYFFCIADGLSETEMIALLKAFSIFKKWQQSSLQLLISWTQTPPYYTSLLQQVATYKYRKDLHFKLDLDPHQTARLILGSYAFLFYGKTSNQDWMLTAATLDVPVLTAPTAQLSSFFDTSMAMIAASDWERVGQQMILLYKDETYRNGCIREAGQRANLWTQAAVAQRWHALLND